MTFFCGYIKGISSYRLVFIDEKLLKVSELINSKGRKDPLTSNQPSQLVSSDFRNTYCLMGMMTINERKVKSVVYNLG